MGGTVGTDRISFYPNGQFERTANVLSGSGAVQASGGFSGGASSRTSRNGTISSAYERPPAPAAQSQCVPAVSQLVVQALRLALIGSPDTRSSWTARTGRCSGYWLSTVPRQASDLHRQRYLQRGIKTPLNASVRPMFKLRQGNTSAGTCGAHHWPKKRNVGLET
jgi:hypothetical protein